MKAKASTTEKREHIEFIRKVVKDNRLIEDRVRLLKQHGYEIGSFAFGSGGVGQIKEMKSGITRIQISYASGSYNYALGVEL